MARSREGTVRQALGKRSQGGVAELIEEIVQVREIELNRINPNPTQPRRRIDAAQIDELAQSIAIHGLIQPIVVRPTESGYELIAGSRRLQAMRVLDRPCITALVLRSGDAETVALIENLQRVDLDPIDEAFALKSLKDRQDCTLEELQRLVGKSLSYLSEIMSLLRLPEPILNEVRALAAEGRQIPRASLIELVRIKEPSHQLVAWKDLAAGDGGRAEIRAARTRKPGDNASPTLADATRRLTKVEELLDRTAMAPLWHQPELREILLKLRNRIDAVLTNGT
jgi:ParB family transcriptional regulator, chromosome partitioning protein